MAQGKDPNQLGLIDTGESGKPTHVVSAFLLLRWPIEWRINGRRGVNMRRAQGIGHISRDGLFKAFRAVLAIISVTLQVLGAIYSIVRRYER